MSRPGDWSPLAAGDPVPGDPYEVGALSRELRDLAQSLREQAERLSSLSTSDYWEGEAAETFDETAGKVADDLHRMLPRYEAAYEAVASYVGPLEEEQSVSLGILHEAQELERRDDAARARLGIPMRRVSPVLYAPRPADATPAENADRDTVEQYAGDLRRLQDRLEDSSGRVRHAAEKAASRLRDVIDHDGLKDSRWDKLKHAVKSVAKWVADNLNLKAISSILSKLASVVGILALVLCWVPGLGELLAGLALVLAGAVLLVDTVLAMAGEGSWGKVLIDAAMVLAGGVAKGLQGGFKGLMAGGKLAAAAERSLPAIARAGGQATDDVALALRSGDLSLASQLSGLGEARLGRLLGGQLSSITRAEGGILSGGRTALLDATPPPLRLNPFTNLAEDVAAARHLTVSGVGQGISEARSFVGGLTSESVTAALRLTPDASLIARTVAYGGANLTFVTHDVLDAWTGTALFPGEEALIEAGRTDG